MKTSFITQIIKNIFMFMALHTEMRLLIFTRRVMALITVRLIFFMCSYNRPWHQQRLK